MRKLAIVLAILVIAAPVMANQIDKLNENEIPMHDPPIPGPIWEGGRDVLYDNGPFETAPGLSVLESVTLLANTLGYGHQFQLDLRISDQFEIPVGETWNISSMTFFAYQTGSTTASTFTGVYVEIWDGSPDLPGSSPIWGDLFTNRMSSTVWSGVYRVTETTMNPPATNRPIMANDCDVVVTLGAGTYWLVWQSDGTLGSGPWAPPITIPGVLNTGDGLQYNGGWLPVADSGSFGTAGFPFIIEGSMPTPVEEVTWGSIKSLYR